MPIWAGGSSNSACRERVTGRRGGFRTIVAYRAGSRAVFIFGFAKNVRDNISAADERELGKPARCFWGSTRGELKS